MNVAAIPIDWVEAVWLVFGVFGLALVIDELGSARHDRELLIERQQAERDDGGDRRQEGREREYALERALIDGDVIAAWWLIAFQTANVAVGILAALTQPPPTGRTHTGWVIVGLLLVSAAAVPLRSFGRRRRRRQLARIAAE